MKFRVVPSHVEIVVSEICRRREECKYHNSTYCYVFKSYIKYHFNFLLRKIEILFSFAVVGLAVMELLICSVPGYSPVIPYICRSGCVLADFLLLLMLLACCVLKLR